MDEYPLKISPKSRDVLIKVRAMVPPLLPKFHKGQMGRVAVIGGSKDYTGAPYFSAIASAKTGADMNHVICEPQAAQVIKTYSPNLMVHPLMRQSHHAAKCDSASSIADRIIDMLLRLHVLVIGPGLGRDQLMLDTCAFVIEAARNRDMPIILDADGLNLAQMRPELIQGYNQCIMTPNLVEFKRLCKSKNICNSGLDKSEIAKELAKAFGGVIIIQKGTSDYISDGKRTLICDIEGGLKRSGGQGDTLTGCLATFFCWRKAYMEDLWDHDKNLDESELLLLAAFGGSALTRESSHLAFLKKGRSLEASDLTDEIQIAFKNLYESSLPKV